MEKVLKNKHVIMSVLLMITMLLLFMPYGQRDVYGASKVHFEYGNIKIGTNTKYQVNLLDKEGNKISASKVTWKCADKSIAKISKKGLLSGIKKGKTKVIAKYNGKTYKTTVQVYKLDNKKIKKSFGIPSDVKVKVEKEKVYYWWEGQSWMVPVRVYLTDGTLIAGAHCKVNAPDTMKSIWVDLSVLK